MSAPPPDSGGSAGPDPRTDRSHLLTEQVNPRTVDIDRLPVREVLERFHAEDRLAVEAVSEVLDDVARAVDLVVAAFRRGGRLFYVGAGTSGRLGVLDASEIPPTFGIDPSRVQGVIAGGFDALVRAQERAEDDPEAGARAMVERAVGGDDVVMGIAAGSTTPYVLGALRTARSRGAATVFLTCVDPADAEAVTEVDVVIAPRTGPEAIVGSTRMKAGTATKLVLNMLTTATMVRLGKTYGNLMVDLVIGSDKIEDRARRILEDLLDVDADAARRLLAESGGRVKTALVMGRLGVDRERAEGLLEEAGGFLRTAWGET